MKSKADERQIITREQLGEIELKMIRQEHVKRYSLVRRFSYGRVLDLACGSGYGSFLISGNPDVVKVTGVDIDNSAILSAKKEFSTPKTNFLVSTPDKVKGKFDTLVCIETIEHIFDLETIPNLVKNSKIDNLIISFPNKKTLHYNKHHKHDFVRQDIVLMFPDHIVYHEIGFADSTALLLIRKPAKAPSALFRNIQDL